MTRLFRWLARPLNPRRAWPAPSPSRETETVVVAATFDFDGPIDPWGDEVEVVTFAVTVPPVGVIRWDYQVEDIRPTVAGSTSHPSSA